MVQAILMDSIADLRAQIARLDLHLGEVAERVGMHRSRLSKILHGRIGPQIIEAELPRIWKAVAAMTPRPPRKRRRAAA